MEHKKIIGGLVGVPNPRPDWNQNDKTKADYIKNKPAVYTKKESDVLLDDKADKSGVNREFQKCLSYQGAVETYSRLPSHYQLPSLRGGYLFYVKDECKYYAWDAYEMVWVELGEAPKDLVARTDIEKIKKQLDKKADASDITNVYRFRGSVSTVDNLPFEYKFEVGGVPKDENGNTIGTYDESTGFFTFDYSVTPTDEEEKRIIIPLKKLVQLPNSHYVLGYIDFGNISLSAGDGLDVYKYVGEIACLPLSKRYETEISEIAIVIYTNEETENCTFSLKGKGAIKAGIWKVETERAEVYTEFKSGDIYNTLDTGMNFAWTGAEWDSLGGSGRDDEARADIDKLEAELDKKANKEDLVSAYKFCGSVEKCEDLPFKYDLIPNGVPTINGEPCGSFENGKVTFNEISVEAGVEIIVPIERIELKPGYYYIDKISADDTIHHSNPAVNVGGVDSYGCTLVCLPVYIGETKTVDHIVLFDPNNILTISGSTTTFGTLPKVDESWFEEYQTPNIPYEVYEQGAVYNVLKDGMNYAWTGTEWDALGGEHKDLEAREQIGDIETALDSIIEIQNSLIGGDGV